MIFQKVMNFTFSVPEITTVGAMSKIYFELGYPGKHSILTKSLYTTHIEATRIYIPPGEVYGDYEKMLLPFDTPTWIAIALMIIVSVLTILAIKLKPLRSQKIIFGENNRSPFMNFVAIVLNGSQINNMTGNVPRIFLLTMIFWSLIFR
jgi:hypothetical protein